VVKETKQDEWIAPPSKKRVVEEKKEIKQKPK
jgi:hypothetical protein